jgi:Zn-dependent peptidase ImmA (M78 family)
MDRPLKTINEIVKGKAAITPQTALQLERIFEMPATFWNGLEANFREDQARLDEREGLRTQVDWLKQFPIRDMIRRRAPIEYSNDRVDLLENMLRFFAVSSPSAWRRQLAASGALFRQSAVFSASPPAVAVWLRWGEIEAERIECAPFDPGKFKVMLNQIRALTREENPAAFVPKMQQLCASAGVAVVFIPELPKTRVSGATRWLTPSKAMIILSLRGKSHDRLWFTFFHEAAHILLHGRREGFIDTDPDAAGLPDLKEDQANRFAQDFLIPPSDYARIVKSHSNDAHAIRRFAREIGIHPGIVVGRLQNDHEVPYSYGNNLKPRYNWPWETAEPRA